METLVQAAGLCLAAAVLASVLRRDAPELGLLLAAGAAGVGGALVLGAADDVFALGRELAALTGLSSALFLPLLKVIAVSLVGRVGAALCLDAGQSALARVLETAGALCALSCAAPLLRAVTELLEGWL